MYKLKLVGHHKRVSNPWSVVVFWVGLLMPLTVMGLDKPDLDDNYQKGFDRAWEKAAQAKAPSRDCASVVGAAIAKFRGDTATNETKQAAVTAIHACYVIAAAEFLDTLLETGEPNQNACGNAIRAMTVHRSGLRSQIAKAELDSAEYNREVNQLVGDKVRSACPDSASIILGE